MLWASRGTSLPAELAARGARLSARNESGKYFVSSRNRELEPSRIQFAFLFSCQVSRSIPGGGVEQNGCRNAHIETLDETVHGDAYAERGVACQTLLYAISLVAQDQGQFGKPFEISRSDVPIRMGESKLEALVSQVIGHGVDVAMLDDVHPAMTSFRYPLRRNKAFPFGQDVDPLNAEGVART